MEIVTTPDGWLRFVCHKRGLLTSGYGSRSNLENSASHHEYTLELIERYRRFFPNGAPN
jgi:hypothetical protein